MPKVTIYVSSGKVSVREVPAGTLLLHTLDGGVETPCGGHGRCGKCRVTVQGRVSPAGPQEAALLDPEALNSGIRLACLAAVEGDCAVVLSASRAVQAISGDGAMPAFMPMPIFEKYGAAVDIGTTTLAARLYDRSGSLLAQAAAPNPQRVYGADVISRIEKSLAGEREALARCIRDGVDALLRQMESQAGVDAEAVDAVVLTGNTTMLYLLTGRDVDCLSHAPFIADELFGRYAEPEELTLSAAPGARLYLPRCMSAFVGADVTSALVASQICTRAESALLADIGTNGELALWHNGRLLCCSTAAGPVFEGAAISRGMQAGPGAIDRVTWENGKISCHTIGDVPAAGICGSGIIDAAAVFCREEIIDETGAFTDREDEYPLTPEVALTQKDIRMLQLAKSAICAGMLTLLEAEGIAAEGPGWLIIAGGFGSFLNLHSAACIGLFPAELEGRACAIGNAALAGASMMLLRGEFRTQGTALAKMSETVDLSSSPVFMGNYVECMSFESELAAEGKTAEAACECATAAPEE